MRTKILLLEAILLLLLWKACHAAEGERLRAWAEGALFPDGREVVEAWGRSLSGEEERVAALRQGERP